MDRDHLQDKQDPMLDFEQQTAHPSPSWDNFMEEQWVSPTAPGPHSLRAWLGNAVSSKALVAVDFMRRRRANLLIVGNDRRIATELIAATLLSLGVQLTHDQIQGPPTFSVLDFSAADAGENLTALANLLPFALAYGHTNRQQQDIIQRVAQEVQRRLDANVSSARPLFLFLNGLHHDRDLRRDEPGFAKSPSANHGLREALIGLGDAADRGMAHSSGTRFGGASASEGMSPATLVAQLTLILRAGPEVGVHTVAWCDTLNHLSRVFDHDTLGEFGLRVGLQMSNSDSNVLFNVPTANQLGSNRALLYDAASGTMEQFRPYR